MVAKRLFSDPIKEILDNSPEEISVIEMGEGSKYLDILYVNEKKSRAFGLTAKEIIGKKCYEVFEPRRIDIADREGACPNCPSGEAYNLPGKAKRIDWEFVHPRRKETRFTNIRCVRIPNRTAVIEICSDSTIVKRISQLTGLLVKAKSILEIEEILFDGFLKWMYFDRVEYYILDEEKNYFILKKIKKAQPDSDFDFKRMIVDIPVNEAVTLANEYHSGLKNAEPNLCYIREFENSSSVPVMDFKGLSIKKEPNETVLEREMYPYWLEIPIVYNSHVVALFRLDISKLREFDLWPIDDYDIELFNIFTKHIGQAWENVRLLDLRALRKIDESVLNCQNEPISEILKKIVKHGKNFLAVDNAFLFLEVENNVEIIRSNDEQINESFLVPIEKSLYAEVKMEFEQDASLKCKTSKDIIPKKHKLYKDMALLAKLEKYSKNVGCFYPIFNDIKKVCGAWFIENSASGISHVKLKERIDILAKNTQIAIRTITQYKQLENETENVKKMRNAAEKSFAEKEAFYQSAEHEMIAPLGPIMHTFDLFKRRAKALGITDKKLLLLPDDGIRHCKFLTYTFNNIDFVRTDEVDMLREPLQIFKDVIIPIVETVREYAKRFGVEIVYSGYKNVAPCMELDPNLMRNVFFNLLRNAIRYSAKGATVYVKGVGETEGMSIIQIENTGIGIPPGWEEKIFELYERADNAKKMTTAGSGIGLFITNKIIKAHGGTVEVYKRYNPTIFSLKLPNRIKELL